MSDLGTVAPSPADELPLTPTEKRKMMVRAAEDFDRIFSKESAEEAVDNAVAQGKISLASPPDDDDAARFNWNDDESIVLEEQPRTAIYENPNGDIVIRQYAWPDDDDTVIVCRSNLMKFVDRLTEVAGVPSFGGPEPKPTPKRK